MRQHVLVMAKSPMAGRVKTRLCPPCSPEEAAAVAEAALADTLQAVAACGAERKVLALDGAPGPWLPPGFEVLPQRGNRLDERLAYAWADTGGVGLQIGMDTPQVSAAALDRLLTLGEGSGRRAVLGHAADGGWWVIGLPVVDPQAVFTGVAMSSRLTGAHQERRLRSLGFAVAQAPVYRDIDTVEDLVAVAAAAPGITTADVARRLRLNERAA